MKRTSCEAGNSTSNVPSKKQAISQGKGKILSRYIILWDKIYKSMFQVNFKSNYNYNLLYQKKKNNNNK